MIVSEEKKREKKIAANVEELDKNNRLTKRPTDAALGYVRQFAPRASYSAMD